MCNNNIYCKMLKNLRICYICSRAATIKSGTQTTMGFHCKQCESSYKNICSKCFKIDNKKFYKKTQMCSICYDKREEKMLICTLCNSMKAPRWYNLDKIKKQKICKNCYTKNHKLKKQL